MSIYVEDKVKKIFIGTTKVKSISWGNTKMWVSTVQINVPTLTSSHTYTGSVQTPTWSGYDSSKMTIGGTTSSTNAGTYAVTFTPLEGYSWDAEGNDTAPRSVNWSIAQKSISGATVTLGATNTYTGSVLTQTVSSVIIDGLSATYSISGNTGTNAGSYILTCTGTGNFIGTVTSAWVINKANSSITLASTLLEIPTGSTNTYSVAITSVVGDGTIRIGTVSLAVDATISGQNVLITPLTGSSASGTVEVYISETDNYKRSNVGLNIIISKHITITVTGAGSTSTSAMYYASYLMNYSTEQKIYSATTFTVPASDITQYRIYGKYGATHEVGVRVNGQVGTITSGDERKFVRLLTLSSSYNAVTINLCAGKDHVTTDTVYVDVTTT